MNIIDDDEREVHIIFPPDWSVRQMAEWCMARPDYEGQHGLWVFGSWLGFPAIDRSKGEYYDLLLPI